MSGAADSRHAASARTETASARPNNRSSSTQQSPESDGAEQSEAGSESIVTPTDVAPLLAPLPLAAAAAQAGPGGESAARTQQQRSEFPAAAAGAAAQPQLATGGETSPTPSGADGRAHATAGHPEAAPAEPGAETSSSVPPVATASSSERMAAESRMDGAMAAALPPRDSAGLTSAPASVPPGEAAAPHRAYAYQPPMAQLAPAAVAVALRGGGKEPTRLIVAIRPVELGQVEVTLEQRDDGPARLRILAERPETLSLLLRERPALEQALNQAGLEASPGTLSFGLSDQPRQDAQDGSQRREPTAPRGWSTATPQGSSPALPRPTQVAPRGLLDLAL